MLRKCVEIQKNFAIILNTGIYKIIIKVNKNMAVRRKKARRGAKKKKARRRR